MKVYFSAEEYIEEKLKEVCNREKVQFYTSFQPKKTNDEDMILTIIGISTSNKKIITTTVDDDFMNRMFCSKDNDYTLNTTLKSLIKSYFAVSDITNIKISVLKKYIITDLKQARAYKMLWINKTKADNKYQSFNIFKNNQKHRYMMHVKKTTGIDIGFCRIKKFKEIEKFKCMCGKEILKKNIQKHLQSNYHVLATRRITKTKNLIYNV